MPKDQNEKRLDLTGRTATWIDIERIEKPKSFVTKHKKTIIAFIVGFLSLVVAPIIVLTYQKYLEEPTQEQQKIEQKKPLKSTKSESS